MAKTKNNIRVKNMERGSQKGNRVRKGKALKINGSKLSQKSSKINEKSEVKVQEWMNDCPSIRISKGKKKKAPTASLRERMEGRLQGAQFRLLNEQLYTAEGTRSQKLFKKNPEAFEAYHSGFQHQVQQWEFNPLDKIIANIKKKNCNLVVADFGCGEARLAQSVANKVHSFDLVALNEHVTACDMAHTPLPDASVDIAVFCLSLMGTNLADFILEANRVLKEGGALKIAEVESRFDGENGAKTFIHEMSKFGFKLTSKNLEKTFFYFMDFKKVDAISKRKGLPLLTLKPCMYKKR
ncbi:ribosomal RNA-processing protein 8 [Neocloeon triangulifer]|uniref:ribosomal RNA-processing protein 8 n=1 Tax=Neocloeon triangulifer TaxID=2078957 RepID=UPI00286EB58B|nr:ribosomal RNA-processing protein 8 [Neocloeon triangulifer]